MKNKIKSALLLLISMLLGIVLGVLISFKIINYKLDHVYQGLLDGKLIYNKIEESVNLEKGQSEKIRMIIEKHKPEFAALFYSSRRETRKLIDSLINDLGTVLTEEQIKDLKNIRFLRRRIDKENSIKGKSQ